MDNSEIEQVFSTKFLAVIINQNLTWSDHVYVLLTKTSKNLGVIRKLFKSLPLENLIPFIIHLFIRICNTAI